MIFLFSKSYHIQFENFRQHILLKNKKQRHSKGKICFFFNFQSEVSRKREAEVNKVRKDLELSCAQFEATEQNMRRRHQEALNDLTDQLEHMGKSKSR